MSVPVHGANPHKLYKHYGIKPPERLMDFSTNTNVFYRTHEVSLNQSIIGPYPDPDCSQLIKLLSQQERVGKDQLLITNGANEAIYLLASLYTGKKVAILQPTYPEYEKAFKAYGCEIYYETQVSALVQYDLGVICNPNNPTGVYRDLACELDGQTTYLIDESYMEFMTEACKPIKPSDTVYVVKSFTKIYKMAGLRGGYMKSSKENISVLKSRQPTWSVNALMQELACKYLLDDSYIEDTREFYMKEKYFLETGLKNLGYQLLHSSVNFLVMPVEDDDMLIKYLLSNGIIIRHTKNHVGLDGHYVRIAIRTREENSLLLNALRRFKNEGIPS